MAKKSSIRMPDGEKPTPGLSRWEAGEVKRFVQISALRTEEGQYGPFYVLDAVLERNEDDPLEGTWEEFLVPKGLANELWDFLEDGEMQLQVERFGAGTDTRWGVCTWE